MMKNNSSYFKDKVIFLIKISRPVFWLLPPIVFMIGFMVAQSAFSFFSVIQLLFLTFPYCLILFGINDIYDYETDRLNPRKGSMEGMIVSKKNHKLIFIASFFSACLLLFFSIMTLNIVNIFAMCALLFVSFFYSAKPLRFKERPFIDSLSNGIIFLLIFVLGFSFNKNLAEFPLNILFLALGTAAAHAVTTIVDYDYDKKAKQKTFATSFGKRMPALFAFIVFLLSLIFGNFVLIWVKGFLLLSAVCSLIVFIYPSEKLTLFLSKLLFVLFCIVGAIYIFFIL